MATHHVLNAVLVSGSARINESSDRMGSNARSSYLSVVGGLLPGARVLAAADPVPHHALVFLAGQIVECALKAYLAPRLGTTADGKVLLPASQQNSNGDKTLGHDLEQAWRFCAAHGLAVPATMPRWASLIQGLHAAPYYGRYMMNVQGFTSPSPASLIQELENLAAAVQP